MGNLEENFYSEENRPFTICDGNIDPAILNVLENGIKKGNFILRCGLDSKYVFRLDSIYDRRKKCLI